MTYNIKNFPFIRDVRIGPSSMSPSRSSSIFGLTTNFLDVAYGDYLVTTSKNNLKSDLSGDGEANVVSDMIKGQGKITLVGEESEAGSTSSNQNKLRVVTTRKGVLPTCTTASEFEYLFLQCQKEDEVIRSVTFANFGTPSGICNDVDGSNNFVASNTCDAGVYVKQYFSAMCIGRSSCGASVTTKLFGDPCPIDIISGTMSMVKSLSAGKLIIDSFLWMSTSKSFQENFSDISSNT